MIETVNLQQMIPTYRRDTDDITGAVRMASIEMVSMEQMPGGKFQITVKTVAGSEYFVTPVLPNLHIGREALEAYRARLGGEEPMYPVPDFMPRNASADADLDDDEADDLDAIPAVILPYEPELVGQDVVIELPLVFEPRRTWRRARSRHPLAPGRDVRSWRRALVAV